MKISLMFKPFDGQMKYPDMEKRILDWWEENGIFGKLRTQLADKPTWSFFDGPITANNAMGVHHAWGRTYKDIYCRYKAMKGYNQRWQNGFDCQGLWVEVEVEKALGFDSKRDIEEYGLEKFSLACRARVDKYAERIVQQSIRMGQWMNWYHEDGHPASYFTMDDNNIEHIWHFLSVCHEKGWLYKGHRSMPWCWRCGTSLSQHELVDSYKEQIDPSCFFRCQVEDRPNEYFLVWTTTPWTLTANTALAIQPEANYAKVRLDNDTYYLMKALVEKVMPKETELIETVPGKELIGLSFHGPMENLPVQAEVTRRTVAWDMVSEEEGTGIVHIAPGCGAEDFQLSQDIDLDIIVPIDDNGYFTNRMGWLKGKHVRDTAEDIRQDLETRGVLFRWEDYEHRYPFCWRCKTPLVFRLADEWFIASDEIRAPMKRESAKVKWIPEYGGLLMQDWLSNMGDWCISRRRFWGLPLPIYHCEDCDHLNVISSTVELRERAVNPDMVDALPELHRPWIDEIEITCEKCNKPVNRVSEVGDCWLDAGIVSYSTLNYLPEQKGIEGTLRSIRGPEAEQDKKNQRIDESANQQINTWFPADWISEMREQVRLWFYSQLFMSVTLNDCTPFKSVLTYEEMRDESGEAFSKSGGNAIAVEDATERMGADVMRWQFAGAPINMVFRFGYGPAEEVTRKMLRLWNVYAFFVTYANLPDCPPIASSPPMDKRSELDRWVIARLHTLIAQCNDRLEHFDSATFVREVEKFLDDLSTWYVRRSRRRFWKSGDDKDKRSAVQTLYEVLVTLSKLIAPILPFSAEELYQSLVPPVNPEAPESVHLCSYPTADEGLINQELIDDMDALKHVIELGRAARNEAKMKVRQPALRLLVKPTNSRQGETVTRLRSQILEELNVKELTVIEDETVFQTYAVKPDFSKWGPRFGKQLNVVRKALELLDQNETGMMIADGRSIELVVDGETISITPDELVLERVDADGLAVVSDFGCTVAIDTEITRELLLEGLMRDVVRHVQNLRKEADFHVNDRINLYYDATGDLAEAISVHTEYIQAETLAVSIQAGAAPDEAVVNELKIGENALRLGVLQVAS
jgi:isoleucyl-tRNA synthetase